METNPEFIPAYMDKTEFLKDEAVVTSLTPIGNLAMQLASDIEDTLTITGSEALMSALLYYGTTKEAADKGVTTAKPIYDDLSQRFVRRGFKTAAKKE